MPKSLKFHFFTPKLKTENRKLFYSHKAAPALFSSLPLALLQSLVAQASRLCRHEPRRI